MFMYLKVLTNESSYKLYEAGDTLIYSQENCYTASK